MAENARFTFFTISSFLFYDFFLVFTFVQALMARIHVREILVVPCLLLKMEGEVEAANCIAKNK